MADDEVYLRRVKDPNPMLEELARQVVDMLERIEQRWPGRVSPRVLADTAHMVGVPNDYVLDERERRVRAARTAEKRESS